MTDIAENIREDYDLFFNMVKSLVPTMEGYKARFMDYRADLYDVEDYGSQNDCLISGALHLISEFLYDAERLKKRD
jgi:hypothetical protein